MAAAATAGVSVTVDLHRHDHGIVRHRAEVAFGNCGAPDPTPDMQRPF
jgi:hypothetical protein